MKAKHCQITGKRTQSGSKVSHSNRKSKRRFQVNLTTKKLYNPATKTFMRVTISARGLKTITKWQNEGRQYDLREYVD